ncbi:MAG: YggS family pyridoxal phosphate-dependent enzyme [Thermodesulfobacteriota bacterium]
MSPIAANLKRVQERIEAAAQRAGRRPEEILLVAVSKTVPPDRVLEGIRAGIKILGENYVQEAKKKIEALGRDITWHFIGHLQTNKAKLAVRLFDLIHSVDSLHLAEELNKAARAEGKVLPILLEVKLSAEESKFGVEEGNIIQLAEGISRLENLIVRGLMTMPPLGPDPESARPYFIRLRKISKLIASQNFPRVSMTELSMGMSSDFEIAIEEGATLIRVGTAIFGPRLPK